MEHTIGPENGPTGTVWIFAVSYTHLDVYKRQILQAVGMTNKQLNLCLQLQGMMFTVGTICVALIIGCLLYTSWRH